MAQLVTGLGGVAGYGEMSMARNDDGSQLVDISSVFTAGLNFFGRTYSGMYVNTNGSVTFGNGVSTFTPSSLRLGSTPMIAAFWADADTRLGGVGRESGPIYVDLDAVHHVVTVTWSNVNFYSMNGALQNSFQMRLFDLGSQNARIEFRYGDIQWTTGSASGGLNGLGGTPAVAGWTSGDQTNFVELPQSGNQSALLQLESLGGNTGVAGVWSWTTDGGEPLLTAKEIFSRFGEIGFEMTLANAAYHIEESNHFEVIAEGFNEARPSGFGDRTYREADAVLHYLNADDLPALAPISVDNVHFPSRGIQNGIYVHNNAAALVGRCADALFIAFRGTNDAQHSFDTPDVQDWITQDNHYNEFSDFIAAVDQYVIDNNINDVYVTGHSLGAMLSQRYMQSHSNTAGPDSIFYHAINFANPGVLSVGLNDDTARIAQFWIESDAISVATALSDQSGTEQFFTPDIHIFHNNIEVDSVDSYSVTASFFLHSAEFYTTSARMLNDYGITLDSRNRLFYDGYNYDRIWYDMEVIKSAGNSNFRSIEANDIIKIGSRSDTVIDNARLLDGRNGILIGGALSDTLFGNWGDDALIGGDGNDKLYGGSGNDRLNGGGGDDTLVGGTENDVMWGGAGNDGLYCGDGFNYAYGGDGNDVLVGGKDFNVLVGENGDDYMYLYNAGGQAYGGAGNDVAVGNNANDVFVMGDGNDVAYGYGANDYFYMGAGNDVMYGGAGVDVLLGEAGSDTFDGGAGVDYLFLGVNDRATDTVYMDRASGVDVVNNFEAGRDVLRLVGTGFTGMSDVLAATSDYGSFSIVTIDANTAVWLIGVTPTQLAGSSVALG